MAKTKMLTLFGKDIDKMRWKELERERRCQKMMLTNAKKLLQRSQRVAEKYPNSKIHPDKIAFFSMYVEHLEALITEIDYWMDRRREPKSNYRKGHRQWQIEEQNARRIQNLINDNSIRTAIVKSTDVFSVLWDKDKFGEIASDRGFQTPEIITSVVAEELNLDRTRARMLLKSGRFTWGQVLVLGAFMQMTPREFCDTFLSGYFTEQYGDYRANYEQLDAPQLLRRPIKPADPAVEIATFEEIQVDSDGRPLGEDTEWFDD